MMKQNWSIIILMIGSASEPRQLTKKSPNHHQSQSDTNKQRIYLATQRQDSSLVLSDFSSYSNIKTTAA